LSTRVLAPPRPSLTVFDGQSGGIKARGVADVKEEMGEDKSNPKFEIRNPNQIQVTEVMSND